MPSTHDTLSGSGPCMPEPITRPTKVRDGLVNSHFSSFKVIPDLRISDIEHNSSVITNNQRMSLDHQHTNRLKPNRLKDLLDSSNKTVRSTFQTKRHASPFKHPDVSYKRSQPSMLWFHDQLPVSTGHVVSLLGDRVSILGARWEINCKQSTLTPGLDLVVLLCNRAFFGQKSCKIGKILLIFRQ